MACRRGRTLEDHMRRCIANNNIAEFDEYLRKGISPNHDLYGPRPIHVACEHGHEDFLKYLIDRGADLNSTDGLRRTPIIACIQSNQWECFKILISRGALYGMEIRKWQKHWKNNEEMREVVSELISKLLWKRRNGLIYYYSLGKIKVPLALFRDMISFL